MPTTIPILSTPDLDRAAAYYERLGFTETARWDTSLIVVHPIGIELHFGLHVPHDQRGVPGHAADDHTHGGVCYVRFDDAADAQALHDAWAAARPAGRLTEPEATDYGLLEFGLVDPDCNLIRVGGALGQRDR